MPCSQRNVLIGVALGSLLALPYDAKPEAPHADPLAPSEVFELFATDNPRIRIRVEQGNLPLAIREPFYNPEKGSLEVSIENVGDRLISAWTVEALYATPPNVPPAIMGLITDAFTVLEGVAVPRAPEQVGLPPGGSREVSIEIFHESRRGAIEDALVRVRVGVVVFVDTEYVGSRELADRIFRWRNEKLQAAMRLLRLAEAALSDALTSASAVTALEKLLTNGPWEGREATSVDLSLRRNLENALRRVREHPSEAVELLRFQVESLRALREAAIRHIPSAFLVPPGASPTPPRPRSNCSIAAGVSIGEEGCPEPSRTEQWQATCSPSGELFSAILSGTGACLIDPQLSCPPEASGDDNTSTGVPWRRQIQSKGINASQQCADVGTPSVRTFGCHCPPPPPPPPGGGGGTDPLSDAPCPECASPILIDLARDGFQLVGIEDAVSFDIDADGSPETISWTDGTSDDAFLALDRNGNGTIDNGAELFGNHTPQPPAGAPNGFLALRVFDSSAEGGNED